MAIALTLITIGAYTQEHLSFKGIPIEGSMTEFCKKLKAKGFSKIKSDNKTSMFSGDFTGKQAIIGVAASEDGKNVHSVVVIFESTDNWKTLIDTYDHYKDLYTRKYGYPSASQEHTPTNRGGNDAYMFFLEQGRITYASAWEVTGGTIELSISNADSPNYMPHGAVLIKYIDTQNVESKIQNDLNDI